MRVLVTGGTGFLGQALVRALLDKHIQVVVFSRNAKKHEAMQESYSGKDVLLEFALGHITDYTALTWAMERDIQVVIHAAALVRDCDANVDLAVHTNVTGTRMVVSVAQARAIKVLTISTSAAACPTNVYGATKLLAEQITLHANNITDTAYSCIRFGNLLGSSVAAQFEYSDPLRITDPKMSRFWLTAAQAAQHVLRCIGRMEGGEIFVPRQPAASIMTIAEAVAPGLKTVIIGARPGEQLNAVLITPEEAQRTILEYGKRLEDDLFIIRKNPNPSITNPMRSSELLFGLRSNLVSWQKTAEEIRQMLPRKEK